MIIVFQTKFHNFHHEIFNKEQTFLVSVPENEQFR